MQRRVGWETQHPSARPANGSGQIQMRKQMTFIGAPVLWSGEDSCLGFAHLWHQSVKKGFFFFFFALCQ